MSVNTPAKAVPCTVFLRSFSAAWVPMKLFAAIFSQVAIHVALVRQYPLLGLWYFPVIGAMSFTGRYFSSIARLTTLPGELQRVMTFMKATLPGFQIFAGYVHTYSVAVASFGKKVFLFIPFVDIDYLGRKGNELIMKSVLLHEAGHVVGPFAWLLKPLNVLTAVNTLWLAYLPHMSLIYFVYRLFKTESFKQAITDTLEFFVKVYIGANLANLCGKLISRCMEHFADIFSAYNGGKISESLYMYARRINADSDKDVEDVFKKYPEPKPAPISSWYDNLWHSHPSEYARRAYVKACGL